MKPVKALYPVSVWMMRIGLLLFAYAEFFKPFSQFHLDDLQFYIAVVFLISAVILLIADFLKDYTLVVISALAITGISVFNIIDRLDNRLNDSMVLYVVIASIAIFMMSKPKNK